MVMIMRSLNIWVATFTVLLLTISVPLYVSATNSPPDLVITNTDIKISRGYNSTIYFTIYNYNNNPKEVVYSLSNVPDYVDVSVELIPNSTIQGNSYITGVMVIHLNTDAPSSAINDIVFKVDWADDRALSESITLTIEIASHYDVTFLSETNPVIISPYIDGNLVTSITFDKTPGSLSMSPLLIKSNSNVYTANYLNVEIKDGADIGSVSLIKNILVLSPNDNSIGSLTSQRGVPFSIQLNDGIDLSTEPSMTLHFTANVYPVSDIITLLPEGAELHDIPNSIPEPDTTYKQQISYDLTIIFKEPDNIPIDFDIKYVSAFSINGETTDNIIVAEPGSTITILFDVVNLCNIPLDVYLSWFIYTTPDNILNAPQNTDGTHDLSDVPLGDDIANYFDPGQYAPSGDYVMVRDEWTSSGLYVDDSNEKTLVTKVTVTSPGTDIDNSVQRVKLDLIPPLSANPGDKYIVKIVGVTVANGIVTRSLSVGLSNSDNFIPSESHEVNEFLSVTKTQLYGLIALVSLMGITIVYMYYMSSNKKLKFKI